MDELNGPLWVFGYGSLIWRPGFAAAERRPALLRGLHRSFCVVSHVHRGTPERPGLVAGLDRGGACRGMAFRVAAGEETAVRDYLREREQVTLVYRETMRPIELLDGGGGRIHALCFVADHQHEQYGRGLSLDQQAALVRQGVGQSGSSIDYLEDMIESLARLGIRDAGLLRLQTAVRGRGSGRTGAIAAGQAVRGGRVR